MSDKSSDMNKTQIFKTGHNEVLIITPDGRLEAGEGLSHDEVSRELFKICSTYYGTRTAQLERENAALRKMLSDADELERYSGSDGHRQWGKCSAWLHPDDAVVIISAKALDAARKEPQP